MRRSLLGDARHGRRPARQCHARPSACMRRTRRQGRRRTGGGAVQRRVRPAGVRRRLRRDMRRCRTWPPSGAWPPLPAGPGCPPTSTPRRASPTPAASGSSSSAWSPAAPRPASRRRRPSSSMVHRARHRPGPYHEGRSFCAIALTRARRAGRRLEALGTGHAGGSFQPRGHAGRRVARGAGRTLSSPPATSSSATLRSGVQAARPSRLVLAGSPGTPGRQRLPPHLSLRRSDATSSSQKAASICICRRRASRRIAA